jgi:peptidoglycan/xylan/chitin deacetylase (PgdA/CDA1 family)
VLRPLVTAALALALVLPVSGGESGTSPPRAPAPRDRDDRPSADEPPAALPPRQLGFPQLLHPLPGQRAPDGRKPHRRELLLSFDDGPDLFGTPLVLDELDRRGLKGIFFVNGRYLLGHRTEDLARRDLIRRVAAHGHLIANHTLTHKNLCQFPAAVAEEIDTNSEIIAYATGLRPLLFRSPYGARCRSLDEALRQRDLIQVGWNMDPQEWKAEDQDAVFAYATGMLARFEGQAILLLHDTKPAAVRALPRILAWVDRENRRVARDGGIPIRIVDYSVFVPDRPVPPVGLEPVLDRVGSSLALLPGFTLAQARLGVLK